MKTDRTGSLPPFHTQVIGSLPRPKVVLDLLRKRDELPEDTFRGAMDDMVIFAIRLQEQAGLDVVSDGEWRRSHYIGEFLSRIGGFERVRTLRHRGKEQTTLVAVRRIEAQEPVFTDDARFLAAHTDRVTKFARPSPFLISTRFWDEEHSGEAYPTREHLIRHLAEVLAEEARALASAGIDIIQIDDPAMTYFCDERLMREGALGDARIRQDWDIDRQFPVAVLALNTIVEGLDAEVHLHCCHSVYKRSSDVSGNYKPILPRLQEARVDRINLEFAYTGTGDVTDLELLPEHADVGMGVLDVRTESPQTVEQMEAIGAAGAELIGPERIALNPDCGFAPAAGEPPTIDEAFEKLTRMCTAASRLRERFAVPARP